MKQLLLAIVILLTVSACSRGSAPRACDEFEKQLLTVRMDDARRELTKAEEDFARYGGVRTLQNADGYGMRMSQRDSALRNAQLRMADLSAFAEANPQCFTADERAQLVVVERQINPG